MSTQSTNATTSRYPELEIIEEMRTNEYQQVSGGWGWPSFSFSVRSWLSNFNFFRPSYNLVGNNSAGLVGNNSAGLVGNNSAGLIGFRRY